MAEKIVKKVKRPVIPIPENVEEDITEEVEVPVRKVVKPKPKIPAPVAVSGPAPAVKKKKTGSKYDPLREAGVPDDIVRMLVDGAQKMKLNAEDVVKGYLEKTLTPDIAKLEGRSKFLFAFNSYKADIGRIFRKPKAVWQFYPIGMKSYITDKEGNPAENPRTTTAVVAFNEGVPYAGHIIAREDKAGIQFPLLMKGQAELARISSQEGYIVFEPTEGTVFEDVDVPAGEKISELITKAWKMTRLRDVTIESGGKNEIYCTRGTIADIGEGVSKSGNRTVFFVDDSLEFGSTFGVSFKDVDVKYAINSEVYVIFDVWVTQDETLRSTGYGMIPIHANKLLGFETEEFEEATEEEVDEGAVETTEELTEEATEEFVEEAEEE